MSSTYTYKFGTMEMLNPRNYRTWKAGITIFLRCQNALEIVLGNETPPAADASSQLRESYQKRFGRARTMVYSSVEPTIRAFIDTLPDRDPARIWVALRERYSTATSRSDRLAIYRRFLLATMKPGTSVSEYISTLTGLQRELAGTREEISDVTLISHLLNNLTDNFWGIVDVITLLPSDNDTVHSITRSLIEYETLKELRNARIGANMNGVNTLTEGDAVAATHSTHENHAKHRSGKRFGRRARKAPYSDRKSTSDPTEGPECWYCLRKGHRQTDCSLKRKAVLRQKERGG